MFWKCFSVVLSYVLERVRGERVLRVTRSWEENSQVVPARHWLGQGSKSPQGGPCGSGMKESPGWPVVQVTLVVGDLWCTLCVVVQFGLEDS